MLLNRLFRQSINLTRFCSIRRCSSIYPVVPVVLSSRVPEIKRVLSQNIKIPSRNFSHSSESDFVASNLMDLMTFESVCSDTLESLCEYFEEIVENEPKLTNPDIVFSDGVLTVKLGKGFGTYVINRQTPNRQVWLSSPVSGPKRYDFCPIKNKINEGFWVYKHDGVTLHELLQKELQSVFSIEINFLNLPHSQKS